MRQGVIDLVPAANEHNIGFMTSGSAPPVANSGRGRLGSYPTGCHRAGRAQRRGDQRRWPYRRRAILASALASASRV